MAEPAEAPHPAVMGTYGRINVVFERGEGSWLISKDGERYLDFGSGWEYMGTTSVQVHDIPQIRDGGLCYLATLPVSLTEHQMKWCETGKARIRGILSWNDAAIRLPGAAAAALPSCL